MITQSVCQTEEVRSCACFYRTEKILSNLIQSSAALNELYYLLLHLFPDYTRTYICTNIKNSPIYTQI